MSSKIKKNIGYIVLILIMCLIIAMFFIPWMGRTYAYPGKDSDGNQIVYYITKWVSLFDLFKRIQWQPGSTILFFIICIGIPAMTIVFGVLTIITDGNKFSKLFLLFIVLTIADFAISYFASQLATIGA